MNIDKFGRIELTEQEAFTALYNGQLLDLSSVYLEENKAKEFNRAKLSNADTFELAQSLQQTDMPIEEFDCNNQNNWFMPNDYKEMDIEDFLVNQCPKENYQRLVDEIKLYRAYNMLDLLRYLKYLVDTMRSNNIVWGVGRGSSVASYALYLIGVHKIDSIKYNLDIHEFLKEKHHGI